MLKVYLKRDLRRKILRGHPWIYHEAVAGVLDAESQLCQVFDHKKKALGWAIADGKNPLALRMLSTEAKPPGEKEFAERVRGAAELRDFIRSQRTDCYRLLNGEGDELPGLVCDVYGQTAVLQFDGPGMENFWSRFSLAEWVVAASGCRSVYVKARHDLKGTSSTIYGPAVAGPVEVLENGVRFAVDVVNGQKTGFFLDQRDNRRYVGSLSGGKKILNLFSYTGGFSLSAGCGGAEHVTSVDVAANAIANCDVNWRLNRLEERRHRGVAADVFGFLESCHEKYDMVIVDPPSMASSEKNKNQALRKYSGLFAQAVKVTTAGGHLFFSSCSSHVSFEDFFSVIEEALSQARKKGRILRVSGQGADHPFPHVCPELRYLKFVHLVLA